MVKLFLFFIIGEQPIVDCYPGDAVPILHKQVSIDSRIKILQSDTLMVAMSRFRRDFQICGSTPVQLWAGYQWNGIYATFFSQPGYLWNFYDFSTGLWSASDTGFHPWHNAGYGGMSVNFSNNGYQYYPVWTAHDYETAEYHPSIWYPDSGSLSFNPFFWNGNYIGDTTSASGTDYIYPRVAITQSGYIHQIIGSFNNGYVYYNRMMDMDSAGSWQGPVLIINKPVACWYGFYGNPVGKTLVLAYYDGSDEHIEVIVDTLEGDMFYAGNFLQKDISQELSNYTPYYFGFVGNGIPFVDRNKNIHHIIFGSDSVNIYDKLEIWHFFWDLSADTAHFNLIDTVPANYIYDIGINTLKAGRVQFGQNPDRGNLYAIWEEFIQDSGRFVVNSTNDTFAPVMMKLAQSTDDGLTWDVDTLVESDVAFGNHWIRWPLISPTVLSIPAYDRVVWGFYEDYDPGFAWQGQGVDSTVVMWVGIKEIAVKIEESPVSLPLEISLNYAPNPAKGRIKFSYQIPERSFVSFKIFDISGKLVRVLVNRIQEPGNYKINWDLKDIPSGIYISTLRTNRETLRKKIVVTRDKGKNMK